MSSGAAPRRRAGASEQKDCLASIDVFVLAGGLGTRIRPVLGDLPKVLAPIGGQPYLAHLLDWFRRFGARRVILGLGHRASAVADYLREHPAADLEISFTIEPEPLGTAGALRFARSRLLTDPVLVVNGDTLVSADLCALVARHFEARASGTILCTEVEHAGRYGRVALDERGHIGCFIEKDPAFGGRAVINAGVYLLSAALLDQIARAKAASLEQGVFERLPAGSLAALTGPFPFIDIGTPESLALTRGSAVIP